jgi:hypothetical protein
MSKAINSFVVVAAILLTGAAPCVAPIDARAACPMAHCDRPSADALEAPSCCCAPATPPPTPSRTAAVVEQLALAPHLAQQATMQVALAAPSHGAMLAAPPEPVPLYLLHTSLLI